MKTLQAGSFLHLENDGSLEALKFTARLLAEHTEKVVKENLNAQSLESLANNLWQKAEYVTRETERRRLQQIFVENFTERFLELKSDFESLTAEIVDSFNQTTEQVKVETHGEEIITQENALPTKQNSEVEAQKDEFLGLVKTDESFGETAVEEPEVLTKTPEEIKKPVVQTEAETNTEAIKTENESGVAEMSIPESEEVSQDAESVKEEIKADKLPTIVQNISRPNNQVKSGTTSPEAKEPFEFGKCTVNLNLVLLPCSNHSASRKAIISTASHHLPPEIEYLEIAEGGDLRKIADLVSEKLARFCQTLPVKYIEQLRTAKTKSAKSNSTAKATIATPPQTVANPTNAEKPQTETKADENKTNALPAPTVSQSVTANEIQQSLF